MIIEKFRVVKRLSEELKKINKAFNFGSWVSTMKECRKQKQIMSIRFKPFFDLGRSEVIELIQTENNPTQVIDSFMVILRNINYNGNECLL